MGKFQQYINENNDMVIYHGDAHKLSALNIKSMFHESGNFQEGVGIYFGDLKTAETYGKYVYKAVIDKKRFVNSRKSMHEVKINADKIYKMLLKLWKFNIEEFFYFLSDYVYAENADDITGKHLKELSGYLVDEEVRNFQISLAEIFGPEKFVPVWNDITKIDGTFYRHNDSEDWFAVINPKIKIIKV